MKKLTVLLVLVLTGFVSYSQNDSDSIEIRQRLGKVYLQHGKTLPVSKLHSVLLTNEGTASEVKKAKANIAPMYLFSITGGFMIGWELGTALGGGDVQWWIAGAGLGLVLCAIPFQSGYNKHIRQAVTIYNSDLGKIGIQKKLMEIGLSKHGIGIEIRF